jgi:hypothetical protein
MTIVRRAIYAPHHCADVLPLSYTRLSRLRCTRAAAGWLTQFSANGSANGPVSGRQFGVEQSSTRDTCFDLFRPVSWLG